MNTNNSGGRIYLGSAHETDKNAVRQAKFGVSSRVKVPGKQGLTSHLYRVLQR